MIEKYNVEVDCANCAAKMENACRNIQGVKGLSINFMMQKMTVEFEDGADISKLLCQIEKTCRKVDRDFELKR